MNKMTDKEMRAFAHISLVIAVILFSLFLSFFNLAIGRDGWTIPLFLAAGIICLILHVAGFLTDGLRIYFFSAVLFIELFYYIVKSISILDSVPVVFMLLILLTGTHEKKLVWGCAAIASFGMGFRVALAFDNPASLDLIRTSLNILLFLLTAFLLSRMISSYEHTEAVFIDRISDLEAENKSAGDFLANVSHEIRTPINAVIGLTGVCIDEEENEEKNEVLRSVSEAGMRIAGQISDILDYSEIDMDKLAVNMENYTIASLLNDLVSELKPFRKKDVELVINVDPSLPEILRTDPIKLKKILRHLIVNGLKYTKEGGVYVHITYTPQKYGLNLCVDVTDTGIGMTEEELERVYNRFYQSDSGRTRATGGLGLGLAIVQGFVRALGGFVTIDSKEQEGTTVHLSIPQEIVSNAPCMSVEDKDKKVIGTFLRYSRFPRPEVREYYNAVIKNLTETLKLNVRRMDNIDDLDKLIEDKQLTHLIVGEEEYMAYTGYLDELAKEKLILIIVCDDDFVPGDKTEAVSVRKPFYCFPIINIFNTRKSALKVPEKRMYLYGIQSLVVDDEPMNLTVASAIFKQYGMEVDTALSGKEAIELCKKRKYDLVFMDHMMPEMDGVETVRRIRIETGLNRQDTAFIALTANAASKALEMFISEGFDGFVSKPIVLSELEHVLKSLLPETSIIYEYPAVVAGSGGSDNSSSGNAVHHHDETDRGKEDILTLLSKGGLNVTSALEYCMNDRELYEEILIDYAEIEITRARELEEYFKASDWYNYQVRVHAIKSSSRTIGAEDLSVSARILEQASADGNADIIRAHHRELILKYAEVAKLIRQIFDKESA
ncbi:MAG: response regulator [Lachnospiraceae bacterium]|nr:response regulator [Lachnospiraceae bacterium]